ncbi:uncharacterized protein LOC133299438 [Gastrolobium bilobum]|uniref:uncharacterized protein LOC133299438 n=1 Tax=Gastrolobium bilobum TaxID=150636 RepID=UPI002AB215E8|nr:uncharacterized protein LOC133299438 [Gastrolobium bilobum]
MVGSFVNLKRLEINKCHLMDEIIATEERNNGVAASLNEVPFSKLETIILKDMDNLETIWHRQFDTVKSLKVKNCKKIVVVFPCSIQETYHNLERLEVTDCALVEEIFDLTSNEKSSIEDGTQLKSITLEALPKLKKTWSRDPEGILHFHNLENVYLRSCGSLDYLFPFSVATHCSHLKELSIKWCGNMKEIVAQKEGCMCTTPIFEFNELNTLLLWSLHKLKGFYAGNYTLACPSLRKIDVSWCVKLNLYKILSTRTDGRFLDGKHPVAVQHSLFRLQEMIPNLEKLRISYRDANMILQAKNLGALFTKLTFLGLTDCEYEEASFPDWLLQNMCTLEHLVVEWSSYKKIFQDERQQVVVRECPRLKIFSVENTSTPNLQKVKVTENDEEWHWNGNLNDTIKKIFEEKVTFCSVVHLKLSEYPELKELWYGQLQGNIFKNLTHLVVHKCGFLSDVLFQANLLQVLTNLEELDIRDCSSLEVVFDVKDKFDTKILMKNSSQLKKLTLTSLPKLKYVWKEHPHETLSFQNLCEVSVVECKILTSLFPLSIARDMIHLRDLEVRECGVEEIIAKGEGGEEIIKFEFPNFTFLQLMYLPKLKGFVNGIHSLQCKSLQTIKVFKCPKLELFKTQPMSSPERTTDNKLRVSTYQPLFTIEEVLPNAVRLLLNNKDFDILLQSQYSGKLFSKLKSILVFEFTDEEAPFPYWFLENVPNLKDLRIQWSSFTEIFQDEQHIGEESLINLVPSTVTFNNLTDLEVKNCIGLVNLITCSTAKSLAKLTTMKIKGCDLLEDVVSGREDETNNEIAFFNLQTLELICLPRLHMFCSSKCFIRFPLLEEVVVKECPRMEMFSLGDTSTPNLQEVQIEENNEEFRWEGDLNETIENMFEDKVAFFSFKHLKLSEYPELKELWYDKLHSNVFSKLTHLVVHKCEFLSDVRFQLNLLEVLMNLEELDVRECDSLEAVFDVKGKSGTDIQVKNSTQLKKLKLYSLPNLKHVWKEDPHGALSFQNLSQVSLVECEILTSLFPLSIARDMINLQYLEVRECGLEEIVAKEEETEEIIQFVFPHLTFLDLCHLPKLKAFFNGIHSLQCKSLKTIFVFKCKKLELFRTQHMSYQERASNGKLYISTYQPLFIVEEVLANVENLTLNKKDFGIILQSQYSGEHFTKLKVIRVCQFTDEKATFPYWFIKNVPNLEELVVEWSSFTEIFQDEPLMGEERQIKISTRPILLALYDLHELQHICKEGFQIDPIFQCVEIIRVYKCSYLMSLVPSSVTFNCLTNLEVTNCIGMINLIACSTAKSLVKLTTMKIKGCNFLENVVSGKEIETDNEIAFFNLQTLELICLPRLRRFCSCKCIIKFPLLEKVVVKECPRMEGFSLGHTSTPNFQGIQIEENNEESRLEGGDLNETTKKMFEDKVAFCSFMHLKLSEYPELKELWYVKLQGNIFKNLTHLVVHKCDFLSDVLFHANLLQVLANLEELDISDCSSLEVVFDVKGKFATEILMKNSSRLKKLTLSSLPKLKHVWKEDSHGTLSFQNLREVSVVECEILTSLFPLSIARDIEQLQELFVDECGVEEIITKEEGIEETIEFVFPHLTSLVLANVEELTLNDKDFGFIFQSQYSGDQFSKLKTIAVMEFTDEEAIFPYWFIKNVPNLERLAVGGSHFMQIFQDEGLTDEERQIQINALPKELVLLYLHELQHICKEGFQIDPILQCLESIDVSECSSLINLVPSSVTFNYLTNLEITNCIGLINLIACSTAKSLVKLTTMKIKECDLLEDVVSGKEDETNNEIAFLNLQTLELICLPRLRRFCSCKCFIKFPLLEEVVIKECPRMEIFSFGDTSTPDLQGVQIEENKGKSRWEGDLNETINNMFEDNLWFNSTDSELSSLSEYSEL